MKNKRSFTHYMAQNNPSQGAIKSSNPLFEVFKQEKIYLISIICIIISCMLILVYCNMAFSQIQTTLPVSYYYTNPLYFNDYGYINSIIEPFYYLGYGYKPPIKGNNLLGWNTFTPYLQPYNAFLYEFFGLPTYGYPDSPYRTTFPYNTLPGNNSYSRFVYPGYTYGSVDYYQTWVALQNL